jgi:hypothetical protein
MLNEPAMRAIGFTDHREGFWYYCRSVHSEVTFNVTIDKTTGEWTEDVLDESFGQPYYYGRYAGHPFPDQVRVKVDEQVALLNSHGLTVTVDHRQYGAE